MNKYTGYFSDLLASDFMPHGHCYRWLPDVLWTNVLGDGFTVFAYFLIPFLIVVYVRNRPGLEFKGIFLAFAAFIISCGITHLLAIISVWYPIYRLEGFAKVGTAAISMGTVGMLVYYYKDALQIPLPKEMKAVQENLQAEVAERKNIQHELEHQKGQLEMLIKYTPAAVAMFDKNMCYIHASDRWYVDYGLDRQVDIKGKSHYDVFPEIRNKEDWLEDHRRCLNGETKICEQEPFERNDGNTMYLRYEIRPWYEVSGDIGGIIMFTEVITDRVKAELALKELNQNLEAKVEERTKELQETNAELESFSYTVSHDLRSPLRSIQGFSEVLYKRYADDLKDDARRWIEIIQTSADRMNNLISGLLDFSKSGRRKMVIKPLNMNKLVNEVWSSVLNGYDNKNVEFKCDELHEAVGDEIGLYQVWTNLLGNALKYSSKNEYINIEVGSTLKNGEVEYYVRDNGSGFDEAYATKLFQPFERLHHTDDYEGTGIGLATSYRIVNRCGGTIFAKSTLGEGATFYFTLPSIKE